MTTFPIARYRLEWRTRTPLRLPAYAGSTLRGAFGHALRQVSCMTRQKDCAACPLLTTCPYPAIFAPPPPAQHRLQKFSAIPAPYLIEPPLDGERVLPTGERLGFRTVLTGRALRELPLIALAWQRALARGIGPGDGQAELEQIVLESEDHETVVFRPADGQITPHPQGITLAEAGTTHIPKTVTLEFHTPLRLQENGRALPPARLTARTLLMALARRAHLVAEFHAGQMLIDDFRPLAHAAERIQENRQLEWQDWTRYSSRQQQKMTLGGAVGEWQLSGELAPFMPLLKLGQWLHIGKETVFGLGAYTLHTTAREDISPETDNSCGHERQVADTMKETA